MKQNKVIGSAIGGRKILTALLAVVIALMAFAIGAATVRSAHAESAGSVTIHVYDPAEKYASLAGWVWLKGGSGVAYDMSKTAASNEPLFKDKNKAHTIEVPLTENQVASLKGSSQLGFLVCVSTGKSGTFWDKYEKENADVFVSLKDAFDENNHADVYYVRKDTVAYTDIEEGLKALEKIINATFVSKAGSSLTVQFETTTKLAAGAKVTLYDGKDKLLSTVTLAAGDIDAQNKSLGKVTFKGVSFDFLENYSIKVSTLPNGSGVSKSGLIDTADFINKFETKQVQDLQYGAIYGKDKTVFRVWAPFATEVKVNIFDNGTAGEALNQFPMKKLDPDNWAGVWEYEMKGDQNGVYYTYSVTNNGVETETIDPYAQACGSGGTRGMVIDLDKTDPDGWSNDVNWYKKHSTDVDTPIVWEVSVNDFSSSADSGMKYKGKYLAFTEQNTTVPGKPDLKTGVSYLNDLGITYVHLNPVYDFGSVDEGDMTLADAGTFNWGYDPQNYNIPEGSYSTDPANGAVRINEFKRMVKALHDAGIGVIMDVVYNHTYNTSGQALHDTVPYYYHRTNAKGEFTDASGCGNETASERTMMRKYIVESVLYWAEEYHIDGFRFDLMGIHDTVTLNMVRDELDKFTFDSADKTNNGKRILIYGEPWAGYTAYTTESYTKRVNATKTGAVGKYASNANNKMMRDVFSDGGSKTDAFDALRDRIAVFNGSGRDGLRGECSDRTPRKGWVNGNPGEVSRVRKMIEGGIGGWDYGAAGLHVGLGSRNVAYSCAHDNYTLWDQIRGAKHGDETALYYDDPVADDIKRCKLVASAYMMSTGITFMIAGEEMGRTKYGNENSYNSPIKLNRINWARQETFSDLHDYYKSLIALRKKYSSTLFSYSKSTVAAFSYGKKFEADGSTGAFEFERVQNGKTLTMALNPSTLKGTITIGTDKLEVK